MSVKACVSPWLLTLLSLVFAMASVPYAQKKMVDPIYRHSGLYNSDCMLINILCPAGGHYNPAPNGNPIGTCLWPALIRSHPYTV